MGDNFCRNKYCCCGLKQQMLIPAPPSKFHRSQTRRKRSATLSRARGGSLIIRRRCRPRCRGRGRGADARCHHARAHAGSQRLLYLWGEVADENHPRPSCRSHRPIGYLGFEVAVESLQAPDVGETKTKREGTNNFWYVYIPWCMTVLSHFQLGR